MPTPVTSYAGAVAAYQRAARSGGEIEAAPESGGGGADGFAGLVKDAVREAVDISARGEQASIAAITGEADITEVVTAIAEAEVTLQTVVAVRDKFIDAYHEIMRMPV